MALYKSYFFIFPEVVHTVKKEEFFSIVVLRKSTGQILGSGAPLFSTLSKEECPNSHQNPEVAVVIPLVLEKNDNSTLSEADLTWEVRFMHDGNLLNESLVNTVIRAKPYLDGKVLDLPPGKHSALSGASKTRQPVMAKASVGSQTERTQRGSLFRSLHPQVFSNLRQALKDLESKTVDSVSLGLQVPHIEALFRMKMDFSGSTRALIELPFASGTDLVAALSAFVMKAGRVLMLTPHEATSTRMVKYLRSKFVSQSILPEVPLVDHIKLQTLSARTMHSWAEFCDPSPSKEEMMAEDDTPIKTGKYDFVIIVEANLFHERVLKALNLYFEDVQMLLISQNCLGLDTVRSLNVVSRAHLNDVVAERRKVETESLYGKGTNSVALVRRFMISGATPRTLLVVVSDNEEAESWIKRFTESVTDIATIACFPISGLPRSLPAWTVVVATTDELNDVVRTGVCPDLIVFDELAMVTETEAHEFSMVGIPPWHPIQSSSDPLQIKNLGRVLKTYTTS